METGKSTDVESKEPYSEHDFFNECKGKRIGISFMNDTALYGILVWVDKYTLIVDCEEPRVSRCKELVYKHAIKCIYPMNND